MTRDELKAKILAGIDRLVASWFAGKDEKKILRAVSEAYGTAAGDLFLSEVLAFYLAAKKRKGKK